MVPLAAGTGFGRPVEKAKNFKGTLKRLLIYLKPMWPRLSIVFLAAADRARF